MKNPKELTRAVARAQQQLKTSGVDVTYTQALSAIAAYHGYSNREEFLAAQRKEAVATVPALPAAAVDPSLVSLMAHVLDRLAKGEAFEQVAKHTGIVAKVSEQLTPPAPSADPVSFIDKLLQMSPQELRHADFKMVATTLKRCFDELIEARGYMPGWIRPFMTVADELLSESEREAIERDYPYQVVYFESAYNWKRRWGQKLVLARELGEGIKEMERYLNAYPQFFGAELQSLDGKHVYIARYRGLKAELCSEPDGLSLQNLANADWEALAHTDVMAQTFAMADGDTLDVLTQWLEEKLRTGQRDEVIVRLLSIVVPHDSTLKLTHGQLYERILLARQQACEQAVSMTN
jgi:hypothetical protein